MENPNNSFDDYLNELENAEQPNQCCDLEDGVCENCGS